MNLAEFAKAEGKSPGGCKVCGHPRSVEINEAHAKGVSAAAIGRWTSQDPDGAPRVSDTTVARHFSEGHHKRG
jgi:hypothetical protein